MSGWNVVGALLLLQKSAFRQRLLPPSCLCGLIECFLKVYRLGIVFFFFLEKALRTPDACFVIMRSMWNNNRIPSTSADKDIIIWLVRFFFFFARGWKNGWRKEDFVRDLHYFTFWLKWFHFRLNRCSTITWSFQGSCVNKHDFNKTWPTQR